MRILRSRVTTSTSTPSSCLARPSFQASTTFFFVAANATGTGVDFWFDRLGVRVPSILVSPWIPKGTVISRQFDHASIPATVTKFFLRSYTGDVSPREATADIFIEPQGPAVDPSRNVLSLSQMRNDCPDFDA